MDEPGEPLRRHRRQWLVLALLRSLCIHYTFSKGGAGEFAPASTGEVVTVVLKYRSYVKDFLYRKVTNKIRFGYTMLAFPFLCIVH